MISALKKTLLYKKALDLKRKYDKYLADQAEKANHPKRLAFYRSFLNTNDLVFDVGANIGNRVKVFLELGCKVIAVEPQPSCVAILKSQFNDNIIVEQIGLAGTEGQMEMYIADESTISTFSKEFIDRTKDNKFKHNKWTDKIIVPITTLEHLIAKHGRPSFCKIDVEGFEPEVLKGLHQPIPTVSFEYNVPELAENVVTCIDKLNSLSSSYYYNYSVGETMQLKNPNWMNYSEFRNLVRTPEFINSDFGDVYVTLSVPNK